MTWMQRLAKELETSTDRAFAWLLAAVMKPWRDRSLAYDLFGNPFALKEYRAMVRMAEEMLRGLIRELARKIVVVEDEEPAPAPKKRVTIGKISPLRPVRGDFYFRMRDRFADPSLLVGEGGPQGRGAGSPLAQPALAPLTRRASPATLSHRARGFTGADPSPRVGEGGPQGRGVGSPLAQSVLAPLTRRASPATLSDRGRGLKNVATEGAAFPVEKKETPDLTLIGLQLLLRAKAVDQALRQAKRHAMRYAYAQARKAQKLAPPKSGRQRPARASPTQRQSSPPAAPPWTVQRE